VSSLTAKVDLILMGARSPSVFWPLGQVHNCAPNPERLASLVDEWLTSSNVEAVLFWHAKLGEPSPARVLAALESVGQLWHAGLRLGLGELPRGIDFVCPTWMLNANADAEIESSSWRVSLLACLVRRDVLRHSNGLRRGFETLEGCGLELGHRLMKAGVIVRHMPQLADHATSRQDVPALSLNDEIRFLSHRFGDFWTLYAAARMLISGFASAVPLARSVARVLREAPAEKLQPFSPRGETSPSPACGSVTVLIPTVDRYPYLRKLLSQLENQTILPLEVVIVDQTARSRRDPSIADAVSVVPVRVMYLDKPGQCSARNLGLLAAQGDYVLFIDDDDEVEPDLIERHLSCLARFDADVSAGVAEEAGAGPLPRDFTFLRLSDVFPTNNCMIRKEVLKRSGLFDLAYDRGSRADGDLGMRVYLSGAVMILNPEISVFHHHAPMGGLRTHKARKITYASSRQSLVKRHFPSATELYLCSRYFTERQVREEVWLRALGTLAVRGSKGRKLLKTLLGIFLMPHTLWRIRQARNAAAAMLRMHPSIPAFPFTTGDSASSSAAIQEIRASSYSQL